jgi:hypothetical protein
VLPQPQPAHPVQEPFAPQPALVVVQRAEEAKRDVPSSTRWPAEERESLSDATSSQAPQQSHLKSVSCPFPNLLHLGESSLARLQRVVGIHRKPVHPGGQRPHAQNLNQRFAEVVAVATQQVVGPPLPLVLQALVRASKLDWKGRTKRQASGSKETRAQLAGRSTAAQQRSRLEDAPMLTEVTPSGMLSRNV